MNKKAMNLGIGISFLLTVSLFFTILFNYNLVFSELGERTSFYNYEELYEKEVLMRFYLDDICDGSKDKESFMENIKNYKIILPAGRGKVKQVYALNELESVLLADVKERNNRIIFDELYVNYTSLNLNASYKFDYICDFKKQNI